MLVSKSASPPWYSMSSFLPRPPFRAENMRPSRSASGTNGRTVSEASTALTLTANGTKSPARASTTCSAMASPALSWASRVEAPRWGVTTTVSRPNNGDSVVGSAEKTSRAAPATWPLLTASASACSSTIPPRAAFTMRKFGLALASRSLPLSGVFSRWMVMKSASAISWSSSMSSTPIWRARSAEIHGSHATSRIPNA